MSQQNGKRTIIIGAGMAGILAAIKLLEAGKKNVVIYEKSDRIGGTWRDNTYPGLSCDVPSHSYTYSFAPNPDWTRTLPPGPEVQAYFESIVADRNLEPYIRFGEEVTDLRFEDGRWHLATASGLSDHADYVIAATGVLHHPKYPDIDGLKTFGGALFHSARWDHSVPLENRRVAVIGTGSTGVQIVSELAGKAAYLCHYQRTPQWIMPVINEPFNEEQRAEFRRDPALLKRMQNDPDLDANIERFSQAITDPDSPAMHEIEAIVRGNLEQSVQDPVLREKLRPNYRAACKRLIYADRFYQALQRDDVEVLIEPVTHIEPRGIRSPNGALREFDVIVLATGFHADQFMRPMTITGLQGHTLEQAWQDGPKAYMAVSMPHFPNLFLLNGPNGPVGNFSLIEIAERQWHYIRQLMDRVEQGRCSHICVSEAAQQAFETARIEAAKQSIFGSGCQSWYLDANGVPSTWPWSRNHFHSVMEQPDFAAFEHLNIST